jgi:hypothetical protein
MSEETLKHLQARKQQAVLAGRFNRQGKVDTHGLSAAIAQDNGEVVVPIPSHVLWFIEKEPSIYEVSIPVLGLENSHRQL